MLCIRIYVCVIIGIGCSRPVMSVGVSVRKMKGVRVGKGFGVSKSDLGGGDPETSTSK